MTDRSDSQVEIVIPVYNEGENVRTVLDSLATELNFPALVKFVYDRDDDTSIPVAQAMVGKAGVAFELVKNKYGRGALNAIKTGLESVGGKYAIVSMADLSDPPSVMNAMVEAAECDQADIVCASRYMKGGKQYGGPWLKGLLSRSAGLMLAWFAGLPTHDPTNSFKLYRKSFLDRTPIESTGGFELGIELVVKCRAQGGRIVEVPTTWRDRVAGKSNFKLWKWLPHYLRWFFFAFSHRAKAD